MSTFTTQRCRFVVSFVRSVNRRLRSFVAVVITLISMFIAQAALAANTVIFVDDSAAGGGDGAGWSTAYRVLQDAIDQAFTITDGTSDTAEIKVAAGIYYPDRANDATSGTGTRSESFYLYPRVKMTGGWAGASFPTTRDPATYLSYLDGDIGTASNASDNSYHIVVANDSGITPVNCRLDGFILRNANANGSSSDDKVGAGIFLAGSCPLIYGCTITNNTAVLQGGGVFCMDATSATDPPQFRNCVISNNQVTSTSAAFGAGLFTNSHATLVNSTIQDNASEYHGGGVGVLMQGESTAKVKLINCRLIGNDADEDHEHGGAGGGLMTFPDGQGCDLVLTNCLFSENTSHNNGGGLSISDTAMDMTNCTIADCSSGYGGGMATYRIGYGAGTVTNCIFYGNEIAHDNVDWFVQGSYAITMTHTATQQGITGTENIDLSSQAPGFVNAAAGDYHLACNSICLEEGDLAVLDEDTYDVDEDGFDNEEKTPELDEAHRVFVTTVDMGCFEKQKASPCGSPLAADITPLPCTDGVVNIDDLLLVINSWGPCASAALFCPGDIAADHTAVDMDDLLAVINSWSGYCVGEGYNAGSLSSVEDCMDAATNEELEPFSPEWDDFVDKCVAGLCEAQIIDCD